MFIMTDKVVMKNADVIRGQLMSEIEQGAIRWVIDLRLTQYMDSSGLAILIAAWKKVENLGGAMVLAEPTPTVKALLELTRLHELFEIYEDIDAAAEYVKRELR
ncbi:STAS domain-containing protein [Marinobacter daepoensis]|uniref:STAS domain-containing protein n=1 Tax=Marinobacter daepoensis TaxID=262077 RepID=UPI001C9394F5|nr:STAS domain-containing protein [Marinobacter daepoensis]MBY6032311.1 STAS domain-containing protein [Marinobacter daepoensis]